MKRILPLILLSFMLIGCSNSYKMITSDKAYNMIYKSEEKIVLIDVRTEEEYMDGHLVSAINIPVDQIAKKITASKDDKIMIYCQSGVRAKEAASTLIDLGYKNVYTFGGLNSWRYDEVIEK